MHEDHQKRFGEITSFHGIDSDKSHLVAGLTHEELPLIAEQLKADVVVYGTLRPVSDQGELQIQFYVTPQFGLNTSNILGSYSYRLIAELWNAKCLKICQALIWTT